MLQGFLSLLSSNLCQVLTLIGMAVRSLGQSVVSIGAGLWLKVLLAHNFEN
jgi:hypothetical protein